MALELIGPHPFARDERGRQISIGTVFPQEGVLYTKTPAVHACQRMAFAEQLSATRVQKSQLQLTAEEEEKLSANSVDLIFEPDQILIRPDPERMDLAFAADELLQEIVSKRQIKFLLVSDARVREAIKRRGECWRLSSIPKTTEGKQEMVFSSKVSIHGLPLYFYNRLTGTRWLTYEVFAELGRLEPASLTQHLQEIGEHALRVNRLGWPEVDFFAADLRRFGAKEFAGIKFEELAAGDLRAKFEELREH